MFVLSATTGLPASAQESRIDQCIPTISTKLGYRYLSVDYEESNFLYDMDTSGVYLGIGIRF